MSDLEWERKFRDWMVKVDECLRRKVGLTHLDLPDCPYADWFDDGMQARGAASMAIKAFLDS